MAFVERMVPACVYLHGHAVFVVYVAVGACEAEEDTAWCPFVINFISSAAWFTYNDAATKDAEMVKVGLSTG